MVLLRVLTRRLPTSLWRFMRHSKITSFLSFEFENKFVFAHYSPHHFNPKVFFKRTLLFFIGRLYYSGPPIRKKYCYPAKPDSEDVELGSRFKASQIKSLLWWIALRTAEAAKRSPHESGLNNFPHVEKIMTQHGSFL